ncbi:MAG: hypothetical protein IRY87_35315 [Acetobacteraceae bacterium]|nr:hypothetical protein [Acetobacteraceae bacterium]
MPGAGVDIVLRPGFATGAPALARIHDIARRQALPGRIEPWNEDEVEKWLPDAPIACRQVRAAAAAGAGVLMLGHPGFDAVEGQVLYPCTAPDWLRRGPGSRPIGQAKAASPRRLALFVSRRNHGARRFYERHGFRATIRREAAANEEGEPDVRLAWTLAPVTDPRGANA